MKKILFLIYLFVNTNCLSFPSKDKKETVVNINFNMSNNDLISILNNSTKEIQFSVDRLSDSMAENMKHINEWQNKSSFNSKMFEHNLNKILKNLTMNKNIYKNSTLNIIKLQTFFNQLSQEHNETSSVLETFEQQLDAIRKILFRMVAQNSKLQKKAQNSTLQKKAQNSTLQKETQNSALQKDAPNLTLQKEEQNLRLQKEIQNSILQKDVQNLTLQKKAQNSTLQKETQNSTLQKDAQNLTLQKKTQNSTMRKEAQNSTLQNDVQNLTLQKKALNLTLQKETQNSKLQKDAQNSTVQENAQNLTLQKETQNSTLQTETKNSTLQKDAQKLTLQKNTQKSTLQKQPQNLTLQKKAQNSTLQKDVQNLALQKKAQNLTLQKKAQNSTLQKDVQNLALQKKAQNSKLQKDAQNSTLLKDTQNLADDCSDFYNSGNVSKSLLLVKYNRQVFCDMETDGGGWLVIQQRRKVTKQVDFNRDWTSYKQGFGDLDTEFWIGNEFLHRITNQKSYELRIDMEDFETGPFYATYSKFRVGNEKSGYRLHIEGYEGNLIDSLLIHNNSKFTTVDRDNDNWSGGNCVEKHSGGFWYNIFCGYTNLNGVFPTDPDRKHKKFIRWDTGREFLVLIMVEMKIRPNK